MRAENTAAYPKNGLMLHWKTEMGLTWQPALMIWEITAELNFPWMFNFKVE